MSDNVEFEGDTERRQILYSRIEPSAEKPAMVKFMMKHGVKSPVAAEIILIVVIVAMFGVTYLILSNYSFSLFTPSPHEVIITIDQLPAQLKSHGNK